MTPQNSQNTPIEPDHVGEFDPGNRWGGGSQPTFGDSRSQAHQHYVPVHSQGHQIHSTHMSRATPSPMQPSTHQPQGYPTNPNPYHPHMGSPVANLSAHGLTAHHGQNIGGQPHSIGMTHRDKQRRTDLHQSPATPGGYDNPASSVTTPAATTPAPAPGRRPAPVPTDKTLAKRYLSEPEIQAQLAVMVRQWTEASISGVVDQMTALVTNRVDLGMEKYAMVVEAFKAQVLRVDFNKIEDVQRSDDGNVYLRVNHGELTAWYTALNDLRRELSTRIQELNAEIALLKLRETLPVGTTIPAFAFSSTGAAAKAGGKVDTKTHRWTKVQAGFKVLVCVQAGIPSGRGSSDTETKIYELHYPSSPSEITYHPVAYVPTGGEVPAPESSGAEGGPRFRQLRFKLDLNWDDAPNKELVMPLLAALIRDRLKYDIPPDMTAEELMEQALKRTWVYWKERYRKLNSGTPAETVKQGWMQDNVEARRAKRLSAKGARRCKTHRALVAKVDNQQGNDNQQSINQPVSQFDVSQNIIYSDQYQSAEETEYEEDASGPVKIKEHIRKNPAFRSLQLTSHLRSLDDPTPNPRLRIVDSEDTVKTGFVPPGSRSWMIRSDYLEEHPEVVPQLLPNLGPFFGIHSVASSADMVGSAPKVQDSTASSSATASSSTTGGGNFLQRLFSSGIDPRTGLAVGADVSSGQQNAPGRDGSDVLMS
ncbi:hypothetical protein CF319_g202 [Tilletia indica]|nr:hypothetical protein CF319_g202 [Tilletia indica]